MVRHRPRSAATVPARWRRCVRAAHLPRRVELRPRATIRLRARPARRRDLRRCAGLGRRVGQRTERAEDPADVYFRSHQQLQDEFHFSATLWTWRESCGDPHKAGDARAGHVPSVWGEFEVDCRTNTVLGPREALLDQLTRAYVRAAPGQLDPRATTRRRAASRPPDPEQAGERVVAWYPPPLHPPDVLTFVGLRHVRVHNEPGGKRAHLGDHHGRRVAVRGLDPLTDPLQRRRRATDSLRPKCRVSRALRRSAHHCGSRRLGPTPASRTMTAAPTTPAPCRGARRAGYAARHSNG